MPDKGWWRRMAAPMRNPRVSGALKVLVAAILIYMVFLSVDLTRAVSLVKQIPPAIAALALAALLLQAVLSAWRWSALSRMNGAALPLMAAFKFFMISQFYNQTLPSFLPGDACRVWGAARFATVAQAFTGVVLDRIVTLIALSTLAIGSLCLLNGYGGDAWYRLLLWSALAMVAGAATVVLAVLFFPRYLAFLPSRVQLAITQVRDMLLGWSSLLRMTWLLAVSFFIHGLNIATIFLLASGMHLPLGLLPAIATVPLAMFAALVPVSVNGWGVRESVMVILLAQFGLGHTEATTLSVLFGLFQLLVGIVGALFIFIPLRDSTGENSSLQPQG